MACRFPGAVGLSAFWRLLDGGVNAVSEGVPGSGVGRIGELFPNGAELVRACRFGGYLEGLDQFDAAFFRISPVEAQLLDPQQRLMLETCWRALEDAGMDPVGLKGSRTGVYAGISNNDYRGLILDAAEGAEAAEPAACLYAVTGTSYNTAIGRVAFALGLEGPAVAVDTACSSSLVAIHQAVSGLQRGEADLALAGGVHTILSGRLLELRANAGMLSPDGRCATFDAGANGYVRGEGCGILALKRLSEAQADGDRIWAVIRGSALNQDGASPGLTVPSAPSQEKVIEAALSAARLEPAQVDYVEAHGTGTEVGDPIEAQATGAAYGRDREAGRPLLIGSVKTNIGHLEAAAGVAGVMKTVLSMNSGVIPRHLHFRTPNPAIDWAGLPLQVTSAPVDWPVAPGRPLRAGVSGFGWSGTNAHVVLERRCPADGAPANGRRWVAGSPRPIPVSRPASLEEEAAAEPGAAERRTRLLPLSGRSDAALRELAGRYLSWLAEPGDGPGAGEGADAALLADMAWTAGVGRTHFDCRAGVPFRDVRSLREALEALAEGEEVAAPRVASKVAFAYTGQASQWVGMGEALYESEPAVRAVLDRCDALLREDRGGSLLDVMFGRSGDAGDLDDPKWKQPAIYALECALTALWSSLGIRPDVVLGHSLGEIAAAQAAGVFGLEDGLRFAAARGELIGAVPGDGAMAAVFAPPSRVTATVEEHNAEYGGVGVSVAADNGAHQVVSGPLEALEALERRFEADGVRAVRLRKSPAYHSAMVEPALDDLEAALVGTTFAPPSVPFVSNLTGRIVEADDALDAAYWKRQAREQVAFRACIETLAELDVDAVVEIGPHAVLSQIAAMSWPASAEAGAPATISSLLRPGSKVSEAEAETSFVAAVAAAYEAGLPVRFGGLFEGEARRRIALPGYPFQRERHWVEASKRRRRSAGHPLLGDRHETARGDVMFETEILPSDPAWLNDHRVFGRLIAPGALYGAMAASASAGEGAAAAAVDDFQLLNPLIFAEEEPGDGNDGPERTVQILLDAPGEETSRRVQVLSRGEAEEGWTLHAEGLVPVSPAERLPEPGSVADLEGLKASFSQVDVPAFYGAKAEVGIDLGPSFRTLEAVWRGPGEALGEVSLPARVTSKGLDIHPLLLDGCFQVMAAARNAEGAQDGVTYLPFGWERLLLPGRLPARIFCHVRMREEPRDRPTDRNDDEPPEALSADVDLYDLNGEPVGSLRGYTVKRATRASLLAAVEGVEELLYEVVWRDRALQPGMLPADFLPSPSEAAEASKPFSHYLTAEGVGVDEEAALQDDLERLSWSFALSALETLGWERGTGETVEPETLRKGLQVLPEHARLFRRILEILARSGVLREDGKRFVVVAGAGDPLPEGMPRDGETFLEEMRGRYPHGANEIGLFRRCAGALPAVLRGREDPLSLLFGDAEPQAGDLYRRAPVWMAANRMFGEFVETLVAGLPDGRRLRVLEVGAGIGSATDRILPGLRGMDFDYVYTDISAGFFAEAEERFGEWDAQIDYRVLDIEKDPIEQGFDSHQADLVIAANVLHATQYLDETLAHCRKLLAPSGLLVALENQRGRGWMDLIFGQLDGWWRFDDRYRTDHALAGPDVWRQALADAGFREADVLGIDEPDSAGPPDRGVVVAQAPAEIAPPEGLWVLAGDRGGTAAALAEQLAACNQRVVLAANASPADEDRAHEDAAVVVRAVDMECRESWRDLLGDLPGDAPLAGVVHLVAQHGHGGEATTEEMAADARQAAATALALVQGIADADTTPEKGVWIVTRGAQVLERERGGELAGATLWGLGKVLVREMPHLQPRMIDLDPETREPSAGLTEELLFPDSEDHVAWRGGDRYGARLVRMGAGTERLALPDESDWVLTPDEGGAIETLQVQPRPARSLGPNEVRVAVEACGLNFLDVFRAMGLVEEGDLGEELCGRVVETGADVSAVSVGDRVAGFAFGTFGPEVVTHEELVVRAPSNMSTTELATIPSVFVTCVLSYELAELQAGDRVLIHAGAGGVGMAAIQLAQRAGADVFATASAPKQAWLRSQGVEHVFDSRTTAFGQEILDATGGAGVDIVLNSLTGEGFIEASLSCLAPTGRFVELARRDILSEEEMAATRPDVAYSILDLYTLKQQDPAGPGAALRELLARFETGELTPPTHTTWPLAETSAAMEYMRAARHKGKIVLTMPPFRGGRLRQDRTWLVTGGLGGIGCALAEWLAERGAGAVVLNGRREPDAEAREAVEALRDRGFEVHVELADVTDAAAVDAMLARMDRELPPLGGVFHSVGVLSDAAFGNQSWQSFETVLWPKVLGAWHLHRATMERDLDLFVLFSSVAGILGNPGQANHAAANAFLDQLAVHRRALGLPGQSIAWGAWSGLGEAEEQRERIARRREASGTGWFSPERGFQALDRLLRQDAATSAVLAADWSTFGEAVESRSTLFEDLLSVPGSEDGSGSTSDDVLVRFGEAPAAEREAVLVSFLQGEVQAVLRLPSAPSPTVGFFDLGMDSLMAVELRNRLNRALSDVYTPPNTLVFDYPNIAALAGHLVGELGDAGEVSAAPAEPPPAAARVARSEDDSIAIVGMACRFPGSSDLETYWRQLEAGHCAITDGRRDSDCRPGVSGGGAPGDGVGCRGGFVDGIDRFDARFFGIRPIEAHTMDPRQRLLLEVSWQALEDAGVDPATLKGGRTGVYAGLGSSEYRDVIARGGEDVGYLGTGASVAVGRIAFVLGLTGPAVALDMACASSLAALHQAAAGLQRGDADLALAGGAHAVLSPGVTKFMRELGLLSASGRCSAFDAAADGFVRGEGCGMVVLKRLAEAEADGDRIRAVLRGSALNQSGATAGLTVPNGPAQERVIEDALARARLEPSEVDYLEAHGAGSELGDPIEVQAAAAVYGRGRESDRPLLIGSVKPNIGHLEAAAGIASLIKVVLAMQRGVIPRQLNFQAPSPHIAWDRLPVRVVSEAIGWPLDDGRPARAGISSFGLSGANAHVVVEGYAEPAADGDSAAPGTRLLPLSARSAEALRDLANRYLRWLDEHADTGSGEEDGADRLLSDMAWTACVGRSHFDHRAAVVFDDAVSLREGLRALATGGERPQPRTADGAVGEAAKAYEDGLEVSLADLFAGETRRRIALPGYPFERRRFWID